MPPHPSFFSPGRCRPLSGGKLPLSAWVSSEGGESWGQVRTGFPGSICPRCATCCREQMQRTSYETGQWSIRGLRSKSKTAWDTLHTAHDAPLEMPDRSRAEPLHLPCCRSTSRCGAGEIIGLLAVEEPKPKPARIRAVSYEAAIDQLFNACDRLVRPNPSDQYSQMAGTQRNTSPATATRPYGNDT
jgi:hypothetical protein